MGQLPFESGLLLLAALLLLLPGARWPGWMEVGWLLLAVAVAALLVADGTDRPSAVVGRTLPGGFLLGNAGLLGAGLLTIGIGGGRVWHGVAASAGALWLWPVLRSAWPMVVPASLLLGALVVGLAGMVQVVRPGGVFRALERWFPGRLRVGPLLHRVAVVAFLAAAVLFPRDYWLVPGAALAAWLLSGLWPWHRLSEWYFAPVSLLLLLAMGNAAMPLGVRYWDVVALGLLLPGLAHAVAVRDGGRVLGALALATAWFATPGFWSSEALASVILMAGSLFLSRGIALVRGWPTPARRLALVPVGWGVLQFLQAGLASQVVLTLGVAMTVAAACLTRTRGVGRVASVS